MDKHPARPVELASIQWWQPPAGEHYAVVATQASRDAALTAPTTDKRPALAQESHIRMAHERRATGADWSPWIAGAVKVPLPFDPEAWRQACSWFVKAHQTLHSWFDVEDLDSVEGELTRRVMDADDIELEIVSMGNPEDVDETRQLVWDRLRDETSPLGWPSFIFGAIDSDPGQGFYYYYGVDHTHTDGVSMAFAAAELFDAYDAARNGQPNPLTAQNRGSYIDFADEERDLGDTLALDSPALVPWLQALEDVGGGMPSYPYDLGLKPGETTPSVRTKVDLATPEEMAKIDEVCFPMGCGTTAGIFAALALVDAELAGRDSFMGMNAVMTRTDERFWLSQGWFVNLVPLSVRVPDSRSFTDTVKLVQESVKLSRQATAMPVRSIFDAVAGMMEGESVGATQVPPMVSYVDYSKFPIAHHPVVEEVWGIVGPGTTSGVSMWINRGADRMYIVVSHPDTPQAIASIKLFTETLSRVLRTIAETGDFVAAKA